MLIIKGFIFMKDDVKDKSQSEKNYAYDLCLSQASYHEAVGPESLDEESLEGIQHEVKTDELT